LSSVQPSGSRPRTTRPFPFHHLLFALAPILFLYSHNAARLPIAPSELVLPLAVSSAAALGLWLLLWLVMRSSRRAALVVSLFLALFFLYGRARGAIGPKTTPALLPAVAIAILLLGIIFFARPRREFSGLTVFLNLASLALVLINLGTGIPALLRGRTTGLGASGAPAAETTDLPDIYYIILDSYAREDVLKQTYGYDNSGFTGYLRSRGFLVGSRSRSNYSQTYLSLASSLNMTYLDSLAQKAGPESDDRSGLVNMIAHSRVVNFLKQHGYTTVSFASGYTGTEFEDADIHYAPRWALSEFQSVLISTTALPAVLELAARHSQWDVRRQLILNAFERLPDVAGMRPPVFAVCHIIAPHPPFVFGPRGEKLNPEGVFTLSEADAAPANDRQTAGQDFIRGYLDQLEFITFKTRQMVDRILARSSRPPVIILQGDHGPASFSSWDDASPGQLVERMAILNAYLVPTDSTGPAWYDSISPVNTFRLIFDRVFGQSLPLLPDRSWLSTPEFPYRFYDATQPEAYVNAIRRRGAPLTVLVFAALDARKPADVAHYARRLIGLRYPGENRHLTCVYVRRPRPDSLSVPTAYEAYRNAVKSGGLPDLGLEPGSYSGRGPDNKPVVALFFANGE
jgi:hypothetical protein